MAQNTITIHFIGAWKVKVLTLLVKALDALPSFGGKKAGVNIELQIKTRN